MKIKIKNYEDINVRWEKIVNYIWLISDSIKIILSESVGIITIDFDRRIINNKINEKEINLEIPKSNCDESSLCKILKGIIVKHLEGHVNFKSNNTLKCCDTFLVNSEDHKELKINTHNKITTYLHYYFPLCIILAHTELYPWLYNNFINIYLNFDSKECSIDYLESNQIFTDLIYSTSYGYDAIESISNNIIDFTKRKIDEDNYIIIHLDEYHLHNKIAYNKIHFVHTSLIYGYNTTEKVFLAVGFDSSNNLKKLTYGFDEFNDAYINAKTEYKYSAPWSIDRAVELIKLKKLEKIPEFNLAMVYFKLDEYVNSHSTLLKRYNPSYADKFVTGIMVYECLIDKINKNEHVSCHINYRTFHLLYEHKKLIHKTLQFIEKKYETNKEYSFMIDEYVEIINNYNAIRLNVLKEYMKKARTLLDIYNPLRDNAPLKKYTKSIKEIEIKEEVLLRKIAAYLKEYLNNKDELLKYA